VGLGLASEVVAQGLGGDVLEVVLGCRIGRLRVGRLGVAFVVVAAVVVVTRRHVPDVGRLVLWGSPVTENIACRSWVEITPGWMLTTSSDWLGRCPASQQEYVTRASLECAYAVDGEYSRLASSRSGNSVALKCVAEATFTIRPRAPLSMRSMSLVVRRG
jgi:hypothetical protein